VGTDQIGRFDILVDDDTNSIVDMKWQLIPIDENIAEPDRELEKYINAFKEDIDRKYNTIISKFSQKLTHPKREIETSLGNLISDSFADIAETDIMLTGSGSIRVKEMGPIVTLKDLMTCFPYDDQIIRYVITGRQIKKIFAYIMRTENRNSEGECYQVNKRVKAVYDDNKKELVALSVDNKPVEDEQLYKIALQGYHFNNSASYLNISNEELLKSGNSKVISTSAQQVLLEYLKNHQNIDSKIEERLVFI